MSETKYRSVRTVAVVRPPHPSEQLADLLFVTRPATPTENNDDTNVQKKSYTINCGGSSFQFPAVYGYQGDDLNMLCEREVEPLLQGSFRGESSAVIAYGQTGAGKSYLCGTECKSPQPWQNSVGAYVSRRIWEIQKEKRFKDFSVELSMIEIYREGSSKETTLDLIGGYTRVPLQGYSEGSVHEVFSSEELLEKLISGSGLRNTDATNGNARSSRSHAIMTIRMQYTRLDASKRAQRVSGKLLIVDLAGAEAASSAAANSTQQKQGSGINVGLSALQLVIREVATVGKTLHYRDSKLTHLLKPALGGEDGTQGCNATFLGCVSPSLADDKRTQNTLNYMQQASNIKNAVQADVKLLEAKREAVLKKENEKLKEQLRTMAAELQAAAATVASNTEEMSTPAVRAEDVVVLSVAEHQELLSRSDAAVALEVVLQKDQERFSALQKELDQAKQRIVELEGALVAARETSATAGPQQQQQQPAFPPPTPATALSPAMAALSVSPILLAASRSADPLEDGPLSSRAARVGGLGAGTTSVADATTIVAELPPGITKLDLDDICLSAEMSNLAPDQLEVLQKLVRVRLQKGDSPSSAASTASTAGGDGASAATAALHAAFRRKTAEVSALRFAVHSYNACLGTLTAELALAKEAEKETARLLHQAAFEKVQYVELVAKHQQALDIAQYDVVTLDAEIKELKQKERRSTGSTTPLGAGGGGGSPFSPGSGGGGAAAPSGSNSSGGGLLNRLMGRSPIANSPPVNSPLSTQKKSPVYLSPVKASRADNKQSKTEGRVIGQSFSPETAMHAALGAPAPATADDSLIVQGRAAGTAAADSTAGAGQTGISPFPIADIDLSDSDSDGGYGGVVELGPELGKEEEDVIDLTMESPIGGDGQSQSQRVGIESEKGGVSDMKKLSSQQEHQQIQEEKERMAELQKKMAGGIDVAAIGASRSGTLSEEFVEKNQHWRPFQKNTSRARRGRK